MGILMVLYAKDIVEKEFVSLPAEATVLEAARAMRDHHRGFVIVASPEGAPKGIVTEWDVLARIVAEGRDPAAVRLGEVMSPDLISVGANAGIEQVAQLMTEKGTRRVLVVKDGRLLGVITARTILARMKDYVDRISAQIARAQTPML